MQLATISPAVPGGSHQHQWNHPKPGTEVATARRVYWHHPIVVGARTLGAADGWASLQSAIDAVARLTAGAAPAAGVFRHDGRYFAHDLLVEYETGTRGFRIGADLLGVSALDPRLVAVVDGTALRIAHA